MPENINLLAAQADMDAKDAALESVTLQLTNALHDLDVATDQVGTLTDDVRDAVRRANVAEDNAASLAEQLKTARAGAALVPGLQAWVKELTDRIAELENPTPEPIKALPFGIGINEKPTGAATPLPFTLAALEADAGVKFAYAHEYFRFPATGVGSDIVAWCEKHLAAGRTPIPTAKLPGDDWTGGAAGKYDASIKATVDALEALAVKYGSRVQLGVQNEPDNDGKPLASWKALLDHLGPIIRRPGLVEFWVNYTGWGQLYDADSTWTLDALPTDQVDGVAFDPYLSLGASVQNRLTDMVAAYAEPYGKWAKERGIQWGIWETGLGEAAAVMTKFPGTKTQLLDFSAGCAANGATVWCYWNNKKDAAATDWRITKTLPADKHGQLIAAMKKYARS